VVENDIAADAKLDVELLKIARKSSSLSSNTASALSYDLTLTVAASLRRPGGQLLWQSPSMSVSRTFGATNTVVVTSSPDFSSGAIGANDLAGLDSLQVSRGQERETLARLAEDLAKKIYDDAVAEEF
jgi:hypothetical protein